jgi:protein ImuB
LRLLPLPREIAVILRPSDRADGKPVAFTDQGETHRLSQVTGPERIAGQWWNGHWKTRDYYNVQDEHGRRHWLFCVAETRRWFVHGVFE